MKWEGGRDRLRMNLYFVLRMKHGGFKAKASDNLIYVFKTHSVCAYKLKITWCEVEGRLWG